MVKVKVIEGKKNTMLAIVDEGLLFKWGNGSKPEQVIIDGNKMFYSVSTNGDTHVILDNTGMVHLIGLPFFAETSINQIDVGERDIVGVKMFESFMILSTKREILIVKKNIIPATIIQNTMFLTVDDIAFSHDISTKPGSEKDTGQAEVFVSGDDFFSIMSVSTEDRTVNLYIYGNYVGRVYDKLTEILPKMDKKDFVAGRESVLNIGVSNNTLYVVTTDGVLFLHNPMIDYHCKKHPLLFKDMGDNFTLCKPVFSDNSTLIAGDVLVNMRGIYFNQVDGGLYFLGFCAPIDESIGYDDEELNPMNLRVISFKDNEVPDYKYYKLYKVNHDSVSNVVGNVTGSLTAVIDSEFANIHTWGVRGNKKNQSHTVQLHEFQNLMYASIFSIGDTLFAIDVAGELYSRGSKYPEHILGYEVDSQSNTLQFNKVDFGNLSNSMVNTYMDNSHKLNDKMNNPKVTSNIGLLFIDEDTDYVALDYSIKDLLGGMRLSEEFIVSMLSGDSMTKYQLDMTKVNSSNNKAKIDKLTIISRKGKSTTPEDVYSTYIDNSSNVDLTYIVMNPLPIGFGNTITKAQDSLNELINKFGDSPHVCVEATIARLDGKTTHYISEEEKEMNEEKIKLDSVYGEIAPPKRRAMVIVDEDTNLETLSKSLLELTGGVVSTESINDVTFGEGDLNHVVLHPVESNEDTVVDEIIIFNQYGKITRSYHVIERMKMCLLNISGPLFVIMNELPKGFGSEAFEIDDSLRTLSHYAEETNSVIQTTIQHKAKEQELEEEGYTEDFMKDRLFETRPRSPFESIPVNVIYNDPKQN